MDKKILLYWVIIIAAVFSIIPILAGYFPSENKDNDLETVLFLNSYLNNINSTCEDGTYYTKAICYYQPENAQCPIYCKDYRLLCLDGRYVLKKDEENFACHSIEEWRSR